MRFRIYLVLLAVDPLLKEEFEEKRRMEEKFANDHYAQLNFIYERSPYSEPTYGRYPVARLIIEK